MGRPRGAPGWNRPRADGAARPRARDRTGLFGEVVHWGEVWTPGANEATVGFMEDGMLLDAPPDIFLEFEFDDAGRAVTATLRGPDDQVVMEVERAG